MPTKLLVRDNDYMNVLTELANEQEMSKKQILKQALCLYQVVQKRAKEGQQLAFIKDGKVVPLLIPTMLPLLPID
jgi:hypothetical protein